MSRHTYFVRVSATVRETDLLTDKLILTQHKHSLSRLKLCLTGLKLRLTGLKLRLTGLKLRLSRLKMILTRLKHSLTGLKVCLTGLKLSLSPVKRRTTRLKHDLSRSKFSSREVFYQAGRFIYISKRAGSSRFSLSTHFIFLYFSTHSIDENFQNKGEIKI
jgi:hypothetical protein